MLTSPVGISRRGLHSIEETASLWLLPINDFLEAVKRL